MALLYGPFLYFLCEAAILWKEREMKFRVSGSHGSGLEHTATIFYHYYALLLLYQWLLNIYLFLTIIMFQ